MEVLFIIKTLIMRNAHIKSIIITAILATLAIIFISSMSSCSRNGYGCRGNSRTMTGEGMWKRGSRLN
jgi:hypothetical protein